MDYKLEDLEWRCQDCDATAPPTSNDYMKLLLHQKGHHIRLVVKETGETLATSLTDAQYKGIDIPGDEKRQGKPSGKSLGKPEEVPEHGIELSEEGISFVVTLPPLAFTLFNTGKAYNDIPEDKDFDSWLFECIMTTVKLSYKRRLIYIAIPEKTND